ncbi:natriuretic peptides A-like [Sinocyclocheilus anshuiensis]|uniref:Natriuretic peptides A-like n=1 Tax=Sinocyclocheilus anshuiensis TaxID=1608454 RepID=A0A671QFF6_9TELE|nr:PREDICTED: natriuretic peptides A-like [Sinocyclocheilus anshuiensis]
MIRGLILTGLLVLLWHQMEVQAHTLSRHSPASNMAKLKSLLQQFEEALAAEEAPERAVDYEDSNTSWDRDREEEAAPAEDSNPSDGFETQRNRLVDLLMSTRSKSLSGCFGGRLDRIGSSSTLGCNSKKG